MHFYFLGIINIVIINIMIININIMIIIITLVEGQRRLAE